MEDAPRKPVVRYATWRPVKVPVFGGRITLNEQAATACLAGLILFLHKTYALSDVTLALMLAAPIAYLRLRIVYRSRFLARVEDHAELEDETYLGIAEVDLKFRGIVYGHDIGALNIDDEFVHFHGHRTEFSLSRSMVRGLDSGHELRLPDGFSTRFELLPESPSGDWSERVRTWIAIRWRNVSNVPLTQPTTKLQLGLSRFVAQGIVNTADVAYPPVAPPSRLAFLVGPVVGWAKGVLGNAHIFILLILIGTLPKLVALRVIALITVYWVFIGMFYWFTVRRLLEIDGEDR